MVTLHAPGLLDTSQMRSLARKAADQLRASNARGIQKHLLIRGPEAAAAMIGAASNACGPVTMPLWDGTGHVRGIEQAPPQTFIRERAYPTDARPWAREEAAGLVSKGSGVFLGLRLVSYGLPIGIRYPRVGLPELEPGTSSLSEKAPYFRPVPSSPRIRLK
jgi:hypothetical protein